MKKPTYKWTGKDVFIISLLVGLACILWTIIITDIKIDNLLAENEILKTSQENCSLSPVDKGQINIIENNQTYTIKWECWTEMFGVLSGTQEFHSYKLYQQALEYYKKENCEVIEK